MEKDSLKIIADFLVAIDGLVLGNRVRRSLYILSISTILLGMASGVGHLLNRGSDLSFKLLDYGDPLDLIDPLKQGGLTTEQQNYLRIFDIIDNLPVQEDDKQYTEVLLQTSEGVYRVENKVLKFSPNTNKYPMYEHYDPLNIDDISTSDIMSYLLELESTRKFEFEQPISASIFAGYMPISSDMIVEGYIIQSDVDRTFIVEEGPYKNFYSTFSILYLITNPKRSITTFISFASTSDGTFMVNTPNTLTQYPPDQVSFIIDEFLNPVDLNYLKQYILPSDSE